MGIFEIIIDPILESEGRRAPFVGYVNHGYDIGGETISGISRKFNPKFPGWEIVDAMKNSTEGPHVSGGNIDRALFQHPTLYRLTLEYYRANYWTAMVGGDWPRFPGLAYALLDSVILAGGEGIKWAQAAANEMMELRGLAGRLVVDGAIGQASKSALNSVAQNDLGGWILAFTEIRKDFHRARARARAVPEQSVFLSGWLNRADAVAKRARGNWG